MQTQTPPILYSQKVAIQFDYFINKVCGVYRDLEPLVWTTKHEDEIGFYERNKILQTEIFFGIWYDVWAKFEIPICFAISVKGKEQTEKYCLIKNIISNSKEKGLIYYDYDGYALVLINDEFYNAENDEERLSLLFRIISGKLGL